jgi:Zn-finger nucleic acid-binding protein
MRQYERSGVVLEQCGDCRGIFLDRGELERLVDAENAWHNQQRSAPPPPQQSYPQPSGGYPQQHGYPQQGHHKKRKSFLDELFD